MLLASQATAIVAAVQASLSVLTMIHLTAYLFPQEAIVNDGDLFDMIIVGGGSAGSVLANRFTENENINVLLIEAGGDPPIESVISGELLYLKRSKHDYNYTSESNKISGQCHQTTHFEMTLGKMLGGSSSLGHLTYARGYPEDFNSWATAAKDNNWQWDNIEPYFKKIEKIIAPHILNSDLKDIYGTEGLTGITASDSDELMQYLDSYKELGHEIVPALNHIHPTGFTRMLITIADRVRQSAAISYLGPIKNRPNLHVLKNTMVTKLLFDGKVCTGVEALNSEGKKTTLKATQEVIVSAGTFNTPKLLLLSGIGPKEDLESLNINVISDLPVGHNLQDRVSVPIVYNMGKVDTPPEPTDPHDFPVPAIVGAVSLDKTQKYPDYQVSSFIVDENIILFFCSFVHRYKHEVCDELVQGSVGRRSVFNHIISLSPKSKGTVKLRSTNPDDKPIIYNGFLTEEEDIQKLVDFIEDFTPIINTTLYRNVKADYVNPSDTSCGHLPEGTREYWHCYATCMVTSRGHFTGTCPMGTVVNGELKIFGVEKLRVVDASVMPTITKADLYGSVLVIAEKAADIIKKKYGI